MFYKSDINLITADEVKKWLGGKGIMIVDYIIRIIIAIVVFYIICKILKKIINSIQKHLDSKNVDQIASHFILNLIRYAILTMVFITIISQLHIVEVTSIAALIASAGVGISLAMQGALSNFAGGVLLLIIRPFKKGDYISIPSSNIEGMVEEIQIYYTTIRTVLNEVIKIPNSQLTNNSVVNKLDNDNRFLVINVGVSYKTDIKKAKDILMELMDEETDILPDSKKTYVDELGESSVKLGALSIVPVNKYIGVKRDLNEKILLRFREEGINIAYNQLDVHLIEK